ncbi:MAG: hypothetical protein CMH49_03335 [Myxococcales bacterium]|nr:hypothetical protein [Myxococcales bacterium]
MFTQRQALHLKIIFSFLANLVVLTHSFVISATPNANRLSTQSAKQLSPSLAKDKQRLPQSHSRKLGQRKEQPPPQSMRSSPPHSHSLLRKSTASLLALGSAPIFAGTGHYLIDETKVATQLFRWKLGGTLGILGGAYALASTGASDVVTPWAIPALIVSGASFVMPTIFDLWGIWSSAHPHLTDSVLPLPSARIAPLLKDLGSTHLQLGLGSRQTVLQSAHAFYELIWSQQLNELAYQLGAAWTTEQSRFRLNIHHSLSEGQGWRLWQGIGLSTHHQAQVDLYQGEFTLRLALRFAQLIHRKFRQFTGEMFTGWYGGAFAYPKGSLDQTTGILGGFALVHHSFEDHLRFKINYNHRHDDWVGGAIVPGVGSGILGYVQSSISLKLKSDLWLQTQASFGAAHLYTMHLVWAS